MTQSRDIAVLVGSLRKASFTRKLAHTLAAVAPPSLSLELVEIGDLPHYNQDHEEGDVPATYTTFRDRIRRADGVLFVTPEYNRSIPGVLKNAIDVGSRPYGTSAWQGKPGGVVSASPGGIGGFGAQHHLRQTLVAIDVPVLQQPAVYIGGIDKMFDDSGQMTNAATREFLGTFMRAYAAWVERMLA